jgi:hypothetical protein
MLPSNIRTMTRNNSLLLLVLLFTAGVMAVVSGCTTPGNQPGVTMSPTATFPPTPVVSPVVTTVPVPAQSCTVDDDCVPAQCCHPTSCINRAEQRVCNVMCTMSCEGPLDCGAGRCGCVNGKCSVIPATVSK